MDKHSRRPKQIDDKPPADQQLDDEEREWADLIASGQAKPSSPSDLKRQTKILQQAVKNSKKKVPVTIRIERLTLDLIKRKAKNEGLPYQTMVSSLLFKFARGGVTERK